MACKSFKPTTPTRRFQTVVGREGITKQTPEKSLVFGKKGSGGRSSTGRISSRFRGGGHKKTYREIDFKRDKHGIVVGNSLPLKNIPAGTVVHNIELKPGRGGQMARSAGAQAQLVSKEAGMALLKLPSGEIRKVAVECAATV